MGFNCLKARATLRKQFTFYHYVSRNSWYSLYRSWKDERLSWAWNHPVVLNMGPLDWESSALTTRPLFHIIFKKHVLVSLIIDWDCWTYIDENRPKHWFKSISFTIKHRHEKKKKKKLIKNKEINKNKKQLWVL